MKKILCSALVVTIFAFLFAHPAFALTTYDLADSSNWNIRIDGAAASDALGKVYTADLDNNGKSDLIVGASGADNNSRSGSGSIYIIYDSLLDSLSGKGNTVDLADAQNWNVRIDGANASDTIGISLAAADFDTDSKVDLVLSAYTASNNSRTSSGSVYGIRNSLISQYSGRGNTIDLANANNYDFRLDGDAASTYFGGDIKLLDLDGDGKKDLIVQQFFGAHNSRSFSGSTYIFYNPLLNSFANHANYDMATTSNFNIRIDGAITSATIGVGLVVADFDSDSIMDLGLGAYGSGHNGRSSSGSYYLIKGSSLRAYSGTGNLIDTADPGSYWIRFDGATASDFLGQAATQGDLDSDGKPDFITVAQGTDYNARSSSGSIYIFLNSLINTYSGNGNILDMSNTAKFTLRIDGSASNESIGTGGAIAGDFDNDGKIDLEVGSTSADYNSRNNSGSIYLFLTSTFTGIGGTGNTLDLLANQAYFSRIDGPIASAALSGNTSLFAADANTDGLIDQTIGATGTGYNSRSGSGSIYVLYNFPHSLSTNSFSETDNSNPDITGSITVPSSSMTSLSKSQYLVDSNSAASSSWRDCSMEFGATATNYPFKCHISSPLTSGKHQVFIRAVDTSGFYTAQPHYASFDFYEGGAPDLTQQKGSPNFPQNYTTYRNAGPNHVGQTEWLETSINNIKSGVFFPNSSHHNDLLITVSAADNFTKNLTSAFTPQTFKAVAAFNGFEETKADKPFMIYLSYDPTKFTGNPNTLKIALYNPVTKIWKKLSTPTVVNPSTHTVATSTQVFGTYSLSLQ